MTDDPSPLVPLKTGPYTTGYYAQCVDHAWTSTEHPTAGAAMTAYGAHLRADHAPRPKETAK